MVLHRAMLVVFVSLFAAVSAAAPADELVAEKKSKTKWSRVPDGFGGVKFGATKQEAEGVLGPLSCRKVAGVKGFGRDSDGDVTYPAPPHTLCQPFAADKAFRAAGKAARTEYVFDGDRFVAVQFRRIDSLRPSKALLYAEVSQALKSMYGEPSSESTYHRKGTTWQTMPMWDARANKSVSRRVPVKVDYMRTCAEWQSAAVSVSICSQGEVFDEGWVATAGWMDMKAEWTKAAVVSK